MASRRSHAPTWQKKNRNDAKGAYKILQSKLVAQKNVIKIFIGGDFTFLQILLSLH